MGTYLTGSCMACSHDQQWEKRWNILESHTEGCPLFNTCEASSPLCPCASHLGETCLMAQHCCFQPGARETSLETNLSSPSHNPEGTDPS